LLVDYVLTVAVSVAAGVDAITSAFLSLRPHAVALSLLFVAVLALMNLRGVKESGTVFAIPTYGFIAVVFGMIGWGFWRLLTGDTPVAESASFGITPSHSVAGVAVVLIALRAFAQGCTALTGVEAVSNGVLSFKPPKSRNAATTLAAMGALTIGMFVGITALALIAHVRVADDPSLLIGAPEGYQQRTAIAQVAGAVFGYHSVFSC
jgi:amino acid transporter